MLEAHAYHAKMMIPRCFLPSPWWHEAFCTTHTQQSVARPGQAGAGLGWLGRLLIENHIVVSRIVKHTKTSSTESFMPIIWSGRILSRPSAIYVSQSSRISIWWFSNTWRVCTRTIDISLRRIVNLWCCRRFCWEMLSRLHKWKICKLFAHWLVLRESSVLRSTMTSWLSILHTLRLQMCRWAQNLTETSS